MPPTSPRTPTTVAGARCRSRAPRRSLTVVGLSFWVRDARRRARGVDARERWRSGVPRGLQVAAGALAVSVATGIALGDELVRFGILHLIAVAHLVVLPVLVGLRHWNAVLGVAAVAAGLALQGTSTAQSALMVIGLDPGETGVDWVPLLPWIGPCLLGVALGALLYPGGERRALLRGLGDGSPRAHAAGAPGRRSLTIYLVHQPILIALVAGALVATGTPLDPR
ncbi:DUF1624 domain-containing protein [Conexibacter sp. W3-3-2]|nr:DUF1624 domain-containing protein [Conexibacter sp. W3-3-2]